MNKGSRFAIEFVKLLCSNKIIRTEKALFKLICRGCPSKKAVLGLCHNAGPQGACGSVSPDSRPHVLWPQTLVADG